MLKLKKIISFLGISLFLVIVGIFVVTIHKHQKALAYTGCDLVRGETTYFGAPIEWDDGDSHYKVFRFGAQANGNGFVDGLTPAWESFDTTNVGDGNLDGNATDNSCFHPALISINALSYNGALPTDAWLGIPPSLNPPCGNTCEPVESTDVPTGLSPPVYNDNLQRAAAQVDDAGRILMNGRQILCVGMVEYGCGDVTTADGDPDDGLTPDRNGAGFLFTEDNCPSGTKSKLKTVGCDAADFAWYKPGGTNLKNNGINADSSGNLTDFSLKVQARNTHSVGFQASVFVTMKYPKATAYKHDATLTSCSAASPIVAGSTVISCDPGMTNTGDGDGPQTFVEFYEYAHNGDVTENADTVPGPGLDGKLTGYYGYITGDMASGAGNQPHYVWVRSSTPKYASSYWSVQYQPTRFRFKAGTPVGTKACFIVRVTADPYGSSNSVSSQTKCWTVGGSGNGTTGSDPDPNPNPGNNPDTAACIITNPTPGFPNVDITLQDKRPNPVTTPSQPAGGSGSSTSGYGALPGPQNQDVNDSNPFKITSAKDEWGQNTTTTAGIGSRSDNPFKINYQPFIDNYPYDFHSPTVDYTQYYTRHTWIASYDSRTSHVTPATKCPSPPKGCVVKPAFTTYTWTYSYKDSPSPGQTAQGSMSPTTGGLITMNPCRDRGYRNTQTSAGQPQFDDEEKPNNVTFSDTGAVDMWLPNGNKGLRASLKVQLDATATFYIQHADGTTGSFTEGHPTQALPASNTLYDSGSTAPTASASHSYGDVFTAHLPPLRTGDKACVNFTVSPQSGTMRVDGSRTSGSGSSTASRCSDPLVDKPYFKIYGSDAQAGGAFTGGNCTQTAGITAFYRATTTSGAGAQFVALASGQITGFGSAALRGSGTPTRPLGLSFANTNTNVTGESMGGNFATIHCLTDYWANKPSSATAQSVNSFNAVNTASDAVYLTPPSGTATLSGGTNIVGRKTIYVDGNVVLKGDFSYATPDAWVNENAIPSLFIIARGNIYVDKDTAQLDGVYVAQPKNVANPTDGRIYTCANDTTPVALDSVFTSCNKTLTINGAFIAVQAKLLRTYGSLRHANADEQPGGAPHACNPSGTSLSPVCAAEIFNFSPEVYLAQPALPIVRSAYQGKYDYITSLPPVL